MASVVISGDTSGAITVSAPAVAGTNTLTLPAVTDTLTGIAATQTLTNKTLTSPTLTTPALGTPASGILTSCTGVNYDGYKNRIINGAMVIDQRKAGASATVSNTDSYAGIDRYSVIDYSNAATWQQLTTSPPAGFGYFGCLKRNSATSGASILAITQVVESNNCRDLQSQSVTLSFWAKAGANFSAASSNITASVQTGTGTDQSAAAFRGGTWTGQATTVTSTFAITTSWVKYSITGTVSASATQIGIQIQFTSVGTAGADDSLNVTGVQLEKGSTATSFDYRPYGTELALCQRYFLKTFASATAPAQNVSSGNVVFVGGINGDANTKVGSYPCPVSMRADPTVVTYNPFAANDNWRVPATSTDVTPTITPYSQSIRFSLASTTNACAHGQLTASAEL